MKKTIYGCFLLLIFNFPVFSQTEKGSTQIGVSGLPVYDVLKLFPNNKIAGLALSGNIGQFIAKRWSIGSQPFYAQVKNIYYTTHNYLETKEQQNIRLLGLNAYLRYNFIAKEKFILYVQGSVGFGNQEQSTTNLMTNIPVRNSRSNQSFLNTQIGLGANYFLIKNLALELNLTYLRLSYFSNTNNISYFHSFAPALGLQYYWE